MSSDPPPPMPMGVSMPRACPHGGHEETCPFCATDRELEEHPELLETKQRSHEFGCPLFVNEKWIDIERENYGRIYGEGGKCTCKP